MTNCRPLQQTGLSASADRRRYADGAYSTGGAGRWAALVPDRLV